MNSTLRSSAAAAAMLLVSLGATLAAQPAAAQHRDDSGWSERQGRDRRAPQIFDLTPSRGDRIGERGLTRVSARFSDDRSGVDLDSVMLRIDGRNVTRQARLDGDDIRYAENLRPGRHEAELVVRDRAGNASRRAWTFVVVDRDRYDGRDDGGHRR